MATNLCAECGTRLPRPEYKKHMEQVHGVSVMNDSDDEHAQPVTQAGESAGADDAPRPQRKPRGGGRAPKAAAGEAPADPAAGDEAAAADGNGAPQRRRRNRRPQAEDGKPEGDHKCSECERAFANLQGLFRHMTAKHPESQTTADLAASVAPPPPRVVARRGGRKPIGESADDAAENGDEAAAAGGPRAARRRRPRKPRAPLDPEAKDAAASAAAAAAAALGGSPPPSEPRPERLVTLLRCKLCEIGFKSKNRARSHVSEAHPDSLPAKPADATEAPAADGAATETVPPDAPHPADELLETVQVPARRAPRAQGRRGRKPAAGDPESNGNGEAEADPADGAATKPPPVRRGGRAPKVSGPEASVGAATDELAALGIVS